MPYSSGDVTVSEPVSYQSRMPVPSPSITRRSYTTPSFASRYSEHRTSSVERPYHVTSSYSSGSSYLLSRPPRPTIDYKSSTTSSSSSYTTEYRSRFLNPRTSPSRSLYSRQNSTSSDLTSDSSRESKEPSRYSRDRSETRESNVSSTFRSRDSSRSRDSGYSSYSTTLNRQRSSSRDYGSTRTSDTGSKYGSSDSGSKYGSSDSGSKYGSTDTGSKYSTSDTGSKYSSEIGSKYSTSETGSKYESSRMRSYLNDIGTGSLRSRTLARLGSSGDSNSGSSTSTTTTTTSRYARGVGGSSYGGSGDYKRTEVTISNGECSSRASNNNAVPTDSDNNEDDDNGNRPLVAQICRRYDDVQNGRGTFHAGSPTTTEVPKPVAEAESSPSDSEEEATTSSASSTSEASPMAGRRVNSTLEPSASRSSPPHYRFQTSSTPSSRHRLRPVVNGVDDDDDDEDDSNVIASSPRIGRQIPRSSALEKGGLLGLRNIGNTCFMNSVMQCLSNTKPLLEYVFNDQYLSEINTTISGMKGALIKAFAIVIQELWRPDSDERVINPSALKTQIQRFAPRFMGYSQQDAQEFLRYLLEGLHEDVNRVTTKPRPITTEIDEHLSDNHKAIESWKRYLRLDDSKIVDIFVGQLKSTLQCTTCGHCSVTFDPFWDLSLPIPSRTGQVRLQQCFDLFTKEEVLDGDEKPTCAKCKCRRKCTKSFSIQKFPKILVLHLKRFSPMERFRGKLNCTVDFPLTALDLNAYAANKGQGCIYNLYGVANHSGTTYSGHYTAYCRHPYTGDWHEYNDSRVLPISSRSVVSSEGYVLFYELGGHSSRL